MYYCISFTGSVLMKLMVPEKEKHGYGDECMKYFVLADSHKDAT